MQLVIMNIMDHTVRTQSNTATTTSSSLLLNTGNVGILCGTIDPITNRIDVITSFEAILIPSKNANTSTNTSNISSSSATSLYSFDMTFIGNKFELCKYLHTINYIY